MQTKPLAQHRVLAVAAIGALVAAFGVLAWLGDDRRLPAENRIQHDLQHFANTRAWAGDTVAFFIGLGAAPIVLGTVVGIGLVVRREMGDLAAALVPAAAAVALVARLVEAGLGGDLPSGHAAYVVATFGLVAYLAVVRGRHDLAVFATVATVAIGPSLLARGAHSAISIFAGYALGLAWLLALLLAASVAVAQPARARPADARRPPPGK